MAKSFFQFSASRLRRYLQPMIGAAGVLFGGCLFSPATLAWGAMGHEIAGTLAVPYLSENTKHEIRALLGDESLASAATWADRMRSNPSEFWQKVAGPYHYATVPRAQRYEDVGAPPQGDAFTALRQFARDLRNPELSLKKKQLALRFAIHIIQDLQQPFHVGNGRDRGGNQISVLVNGERSNLHRVWDRQIFESKQRDRDAWVAYFQRSGLMRPAEKTDADPLTWIAESAALRDSLYPAPATIDAAYVARELPRAEKRLALAGIRTGAWLNATFDRGTNPSTAVPPQQTPTEQSWWRRLLTEIFP